ncbi:OprO/OprP family phosphate-selective porin [Rhizorhapis suberifaciens]|uniref:Phosphate-selective porin OprO/OprP n=1 Tax=Rhizorhapis suberifaciens TaxID=13656 RepID=A0A840HQ64_9SPHN|nr:porin [Rhizorhapis suberifaciens]MBB4640065.1 phosphate-selective porin OprO/OprP [Rhizorhapis suberifaciens]
MKMKWAMQLSTACSLAALTPGIANAQALSAEEAASLRAEVQALKAQLGAMEARLNSIDAKTQENSTAIAAAPAPAPAPETTIKWKGAPELSTKSGWSFKVRGRMQFDAGHVDAPSSIDDDGLGFSSEVRRAYVGVQGTMPGGFGYKAEADLADNEVEWTDIYLTYDHEGKNITVGQHYPFLSLEQMTSDLFTSFTERAAFTTAFGFERRVGLSAGYSRGDFMVNAGVFTDNVTDLTEDGNKSYSVDGRVVWMPKFGSAQLHLGASAHYRDLNISLTDAGSRYRARPFIHSTDVRFIDTGTFTASKETNYGLEAAVVAGRLHAAGEASWLRASRPGLADPTFFGGYAEVGYFLTGGDTRGYKAGAFDRVKPANPVGKGGIGAIQINLRYDYLDLVDAGIIGGTQNGYAASLVWTPIDYLKFMINYGHMEYDQARVTANGDASYSADVIGTRAQLDF